MKGAKGAGEFPGLWRKPRTAEKGEVTTTDKTARLEPSYTNRRVTRQRDNLTALIDWCQITVKGIDVFKIIEDILRIPLKLMELHGEGRGIAGHELTAGFDNIKILKPTGKAQYEGFQILMSGSGCRNYENFLKINGETWFDFLERVCAYNVNFPRIDLAIDDRKPYLKIPDLIQLANNGLLSSQLRSISAYSSGELAEDDVIQKGNTLYLGSPKSDFRLVFYEKGYEQHEKFGKELDINWNRYELRFRQERAVRVVQELVKHRDVARVAMEVLNGKVRFLQKPADGATVRKRLYPTYQPWREFMGDIGKIKLTMNPQKKTLDKIWNWLTIYVASSLKLFSELGKAEGRDYLELLLDGAEMNETQKRLYEDYVKFCNLDEKGGGA